MKKNLFKSVAILAVVALSGVVFNSCKGSASGNGIVDEAIKQAEQTITAEESPVFGNLPLLHQQRLEAGTIVGKHFRELKTEDMDAAFGQHLFEQERGDEREVAVAPYADIVAAVMGDLFKAADRVDADADKLGECRNVGIQSVGQKHQTFRLD